MTNLQLSINLSALNSLYDDLIGKKKSCFTLKFLQPISYFSPSRREISFSHKNGFKLRALEERRFFLGVSREKGQNLMRLERRIKRKEKRVFVVKANGGIGFNGGGIGGGGGGGGGDNSNTARLLGNIAFAIGLTYLSMTGQLGWILDAIVSIWLLAVLLPIAGLGAFIWWAGRDIVQSSCPNCGNDFQIFKSSLKDGLQLCPYCSQPFSVEGNEFVRESTTFSSNQSTTFGQAFNGFSPSPKKGKASSVSVVDIEAEVKDVD
ncbi:hypothetical protein BVC80_155g7 [Macleaya cordata]|uniref:Uncharacterized protein n=1 Tax=Macleaya cordata TaxID=56857 RepID=A0A200RBV4_MACCD|nr:hypothetical protein BVC80_155g7 [Macleaya cordata]